MIVALAVTILALTVAGIVLAPLFRPDALEAERASFALSNREDLTARHAMTLAALRDLEEDHQTGKIGETDYQELRDTLEARAVELMKSLDALDAPSRS